MVEKSYDKAVIDFNFGSRKYLSTLENDIHIGLAASVNISFSGRQIPMSSSLKSNYCFGICLFKFHVKSSLSLLY